jgi:hypothetical protein
MHKRDDLARHRNRQIVGVSLPPRIVAEVKIEAARRHVFLRDLFLEMWALYKRAPEKSASAEGTNASQSR